MSIDALSDRLQDFDNGVRLHVVLAICDFAESNPEFTLVDELKRVAERLRDTEVGHVSCIYTSFISS